MKWVIQQASGFHLLLKHIDFTGCLTLYADYGDIFGTFMRSIKLELFTFVHVVSIRNYNYYTMNLNHPNSWSFSYDWSFMDQNSSTGWWFGTCFIFPCIGNLIIPIDELICFRGVWSTTNHIHRLSVDYPYTNHILTISMAQPPTRSTLVECWKSAYDFLIPLFPGHKAATRGGALWKPLGMEKSWMNYGGKLMGFNVIWWWFDGD